MEDTRIKDIYKYYSINYSLVTDSRAVKKGDVYIALRGDNFDGNKFAKQALESGAILVVVDNAEYHNENTNSILVENTLETLQNLATFHRIMLNIPVIGLTGSNGKTTTKELLNIALSTKYKVLATQGNFNNHIGVPLTILNATPDHDLMIVEMGANHIGEIKNLSNIAKPDVGLITNIGKAHLEGFGSYEGVVEAKSELYKYLMEHGNYIVFNSDDDLLVRLVDRYIPTKSYSISKSYTMESSYPKLSFEHNQKKYNSNLVGSYNLNNIAAALAVGELMECSHEIMLKAMCDYTPSNNRSQIVYKGKVGFLLDAYNANPTSMHLAIQEFALSQYLDKVLILGDMLELGDVSKAEHKKVLEQCTSNKYSKVILVGTEFGEFALDYPDYEFYKDINELQKSININQESFCLVKGSRALQLERILEMF